VIQDALDPLDPESTAFWLRLATAVFSGGIVGLERQLRGKPAGIRTSILICLGTELFVTLGAAQLSDRVDPTRVLAQVVTGIGFLGGGVILSREGLLVGVTSAAVIWMLAAIGALIGLGHLKAAVFMALVTVAILLGVELLESIFLRLRRGATERELEQMDLEE
jgi:putative Mg2+ transporter-C (MgtC) family protein